MSKKRNIIVLAIGIIFWVYGCTAQEQEPKPVKDVKDNGLDFALKDNAEDSEVNVDRDSERISEEEAGYAYTLNEANIFKPDESINIDGIIFRDIEINITKNLPDKVPKSEVIYFDEQTNKEGDLTGGYSYIFADLTIENTGKESQEIYLSGGSFVVIDNEKHIIDMSEELRYRSSYEQTDNTGKDYYCCILGTKEEKRLKLGYIVTDEFVKQDNLLFNINLYGWGSAEDELKAFRIW